MKLAGIPMPLKKNLVGVKADYSMRKTANQGSEQWAEKESGWKAH